MLKMTVVWVAPFPNKKSKRWCWNILSKQNSIKWRGFHLVPSSLQLWCTISDLTAHYIASSYVLICNTVSL